MNNTVTYPVAIVLPLKNKKVHISEFTDHIKQNVWCVVCNTLLSLHKKNYSFFVNGLDFLKFVRYTTHYLLKPLFYTGVCELLTDLCWILH